LGGQESNFTKPTPVATKGNPKKTKKHKKTKKKKKKLNQSKAGPGRALQLGKRKKVEK